MLKGWQLGPKRQGRLHRSWLQEPICEFISSRLEEGFKPTTLRFHLNCLLRLGEFAEQQGVRERERLPEFIEPVITDAISGDRQRRQWRSVLHWFLTPGNRGVTQPPESTPSSKPPHAEIVETYAQFLHEYRGLCEGRIRHMRRHCLGFTTFADENGFSRLANLNPEIIRAFLTQEGTRCSRLSLQSQCSALRGFLSFLYRQELIPTNWASAVVSPRVYSDESCPRYMTRGEVDLTLAAIDRETSQGRRDYAMLLLLATYGIRGIELCRLRLDDIEWRHERLRVRRRKAGNNTTYPLAPSVGNAIIAYLRDGRPGSESPHVFLSVRPPFGPITTPTLIHLVCKYATLAGISVERPGTHTFRYSCAQRLLEGEYPLKSIGDYLGHAHPGSTRHYMKIATDQLREVAMGDGEDVL